MSEHVEHVIADGPAPAEAMPPDPIEAIEAHSDADIARIGAEAEAAVAVIEAHAAAQEGQEEWRSALNSLMRSQEDARRHAETVLNGLQTQVTALTERMDLLTLPSRPPEPAPNPNPAPGESIEGEGSSEPEPAPASEVAAIVEEPAKEPEPPARKRAHRWI